MKKVLFLILILVLMLVACGGDDQAEDTGLEGVDQNPTMGDTATATVGQDVATDTPSSDTNDGVAIPPSGHLTYLQDGTLYVYDLVTQTSTAIAEDIGPPFLYTSPDHSKLYYVGINLQEREATPYEYTFADGNLRPLSEMTRPLSGDAIWEISSWSPDGQWAFIASFQMGRRPFYINLADPTQTVALASSGQSQKWWTVDNQLIYIIQDGGMPPPDVPDYLYFPAVESINLINFPDGETTDITSEFPVADFTTNYELLTALEEDGYDLADYDPVHPTPQVWAPAGRHNQENSSQYCWDYAIGADENELYSAPEAYNIGNIQQLDNGGLLFLQIEFRDCSFLNGTVGKLMKLDANGEALVLTDKLTSILDRNNSQPVFLQGRYTLAPTEDYAAVVETDENATSNALVIVSLETGETMPVLLDGEPLENIGAVAWGQ